MNPLLATVAIGLLGAIANPAPVDWPGGATLHAADGGGPLGANLSGLALDGSAGLWAVRDSGALLHLDLARDGSRPQEALASGRCAIPMDSGRPTRRPSPLPQVTTARCTWPPSETTARPA